MAAPLILPALAAFLAGTHLSPLLLAGIKAEAGVSIAYADIRKACPYAQPAIDAMRILAAAHNRKKHQPESAGLARIAVMADALCNAVQRPDTPFNQALAVSETIHALQVQNAALGPSSLIAVDSRCYSNRC